MKKTKTQLEPKEPIDDPPELTREDFERMLRGDQRKRIIAGRLKPGDVAALRRFVGLTQEQFAGRSASACERCRTGSRIA